MRLDASVELGDRPTGTEEGGDEKGSDEKSSDEKREQRRDWQARNRRPSDTDTESPFLARRGRPTSDVHRRRPRRRARSVAEGRRNPRDALRTSDDGRELRVPAAAVADRLRVHGVAVAAEPGQEPG